MRSAQLAKWLVLCGALAVALAEQPLTAAACEYADDSAVYDVLGVPSSLSPEEQLAVQLPRNVAFVFFARDSEPPKLFAGDAPVALELLGVEPARGDRGLQTPVAPLSPGVSYTYNSQQLSVADYVDDQAPEPARVRSASLSVFDSDGACGLSGSSCGSTVSVRAQLDPGVDDHTLPEHLTYALYLGISPRAALATPQVERYVVRDTQGEVWTNSAYGWSEGDVYLSIATLDHAGNESPRSEPIQVHRGSSGCRVRGAAGVDSFVWVIAALAWHSRRRRTKRPRSS